MVSSCVDPSRVRQLKQAEAAGELLRVEPFESAAVPTSTGEAFPMRWGDEKRGELVVSYPDPLRFAGASPGFERIAARSFLYDNALWALWRIQEGDEEGAAGVLRSLQALQLADGAWGFSVNLRDEAYDSGYVRAGAVAFAVYAFAKFELAFGSGRFLSTAAKGGEWLLAQRDPATGLVRAGSGAWSQQRGLTQGAVEHVVTEHQIGAFFALAALARLHPDDGWGEAASHLFTQTLETLWVEEQGRFAQGLAGGVLDPGSALDSSGAWGALLLLACGAPEQAARALRWVDEVHALPLGNAWVYRPYAAGPEVGFVEGAVGVALAWHRLTPASPRAERESQSVFDLVDRYGLPLPYATAWEEDFPKAPAAGPTLWLLLAGPELLGAVQGDFWTECPQPWAGGGASSPPE